jgi:hypothetical protein
MAENQTLALTEFGRGLRPVKKVDSWAPLQQLDRAMS